MPTKFNDGVDDFDVFNEPSIPEETTLSSGGTASRNHPEHHRDMGDAIEAMQRDMALLGHDHSGGSGHFDTDKLAQDNTHEDADTDSGDTALHHTLGEEAGQAAAGDHRHDYNGPTIYNQPYLVCTSTTRPFNPAVGTTIYETDTNRVRAWSTFMNNVVVTGLDSKDNYPLSGFIDAAGRVAMNPADWEQWYEDDPTHTDHGAMGVAAAGFLSWTDQGNDTNRCIARRIKAADKETQTDDQIITWRTGGVVVELDFPGITEGASNDKYFRMSANRQCYVRLCVGQDIVNVFYTVSGPANEKPLGTLHGINTDTANTEWSAQLKDRTLTIYRLGELLGTVKDTKNLSAKGASYRGWATGMQAGDRVLGQTTPSNEDWVRIQDVVNFATTNRWTLLSVASVPVIRLRQSKAQKIIYTGSVIEWTDEREDNFGFFTPSVPTDINMLEPGLYQIECGIQWDPQVVPDVASAALMINGVETEVREQRFIRGNGFTPGFSQTLSVQGKLRFAAGDVLQVKVKYSTSANLLDLIFSYFDAASKVNSRIDAYFLGP